MELSIDVKQPVMDIKPKHEMTELNAAEIDKVSGGIVCGGLCVLGAFVAGIGLFTAGVSAGEAVGKFVR